MNEEPGNREDQRPCLSPSPPPGAGEETPEAAKGDGRRAAPEAEMPGPSSPAQRFLDLAQQGKNGWWRWAAGLLLLVTISQIFGSMVAVALLGPSLDELQQALTTGTVEGGPSLRLFVTINLASLGLILAVWVVVALAHRRSLLTLVTPERHLSLRRIGHGFGWWLGLQLLALGLSWIADPTGAEFHLNPQQLLAFAAVALVLTPLQIAGEELSFRGYLLQGMGLLTRRPLLLCALSGLLFTGPHWINPEMSYGRLPMGLTYFALGFFLTAITLRDGRLELALGVHLANNLFAILIAHPEKTALPTPALITVSEFQPWPSLAAFVVTAAVMYAALFWRRGARDESAAMTSEPDSG